MLYISGFNDEVMQLNNNKTILSFSTYTFTSNVCVAQKQENENNAKIPSLQFENDCLDASAPS